MLLLDLNADNAPLYVQKFVASPDLEGPAKLLLDGKWCGHGETRIRLYDVLYAGNNIFHIQLPNLDVEEYFPPIVRIIIPELKTTFLIYDPREHPASFHSFEEQDESKFDFLPNHRCNKCDGDNFKIAIGFEVPEDSSSVNDTSWFALAAECSNCHVMKIVFDDEIA